MPYESTWTKTTAHDKHLLRHGIMLQQSKHMQSYNIPLTSKALGNQATAGFDSHTDMRAHVQMKQ